MTAASGLTNIVYPSPREMNFTDSSVCPRFFSKLRGDWLIFCATLARVSLSALDMVVEILFCEIRVSLLNFETCRLRFTGCKLIVMLITEIQAKRPKIELPTFNLE